MRSSSLLIFASAILLLGCAEAQLQLGFYKYTCPHVEEIVREETARAIKVAPSLGGPFLRMFFHDCFVRGCDASLLLNTTDPNNPAEKDAIPNRSLRGFQIIDRIKARLEAACPGVVSCADILALVGRDAVYLTMGPTWEVPLGRRDGRVSLASEADLPPPFANIANLKKRFSDKGLSTKDLVVLSGGHTLGIGHCTAFDNRIYNFTGKGDTDPALDKNYIVKLRSKCKPNDQVTFVEMDPGSFRTFDTSYFKFVAKRRGLFQSDAALLDDPETKSYVLRQASSSPYEFFRDFAVSMVNMGNVGVLTGSQGEIRKNCARVN